MKITRLPSRLANLETDSQIGTFFEKTDDGSIEATLDATKFPHVFMLHLYFVIIDENGFHSDKGGYFLVETPIDSIRNCIIASMLDMRTMIEAECLLQD